MVHAGLFISNNAVSECHCKVAVVPSNLLAPNMLPSQFLLNLPEYLGWFDSSYVSAFVLFLSSI